jgi:hypothetical protein
MEAPGVLWVTGNAAYDGFLASLISDILEENESAVTSNVS